MADDEKPTSIWKKEISFRRKPADEAADVPAASGSSSIWKKEISLRKKDAEHETMPELDPELAEPVEAEPDLDAAIAALSAPAEPAAIEPEPVAPPVPSVEHGWLTQPLEEVSEPPAELVSPVSLVPDVVEPVVVPIAAVPVPVPVPVPEPEPELEPEPALDLELELDLPTAVLPALEVEAAWPGEAEDVEPEVAPEPELAPEPKVPFYKKQLSLKMTPRAAKPPNEPKPPKEPKPAKEKRAKKEKLADEAGATPSEKKEPFYKRDLSFKRAPKEWDAGEVLTEEAPKERPKLRRPPRPRPSLPSLPTLSRGGGKQLVGLKIGGSQIAAARVRNGEAPELVQAARTPLDHGIVVNGELRDPEALALALKAFFAEHKLPKRGVRLGIANNRIGVRTFEVTGIADTKQLANAIRFRAQEVLPIPLEEAVLDYQVLSEGVTEDGQPLRRVLLVVAYRELVDRYVYACRKAGLQIVGIDLEAFALLRAVAAPHDTSAGSDRGALVAVSVGHDRSTFAVSDGRVCEFTRVLEWGGWALNIAIARALDMSPSEVETVKRALSFAGAEQLPDGFTEEQLATAREAARRQLQTFARELVSSLQFYQNQPGSLGIGEIALTGGTAHLPGLGAELERLIGVPVRVVDPLNRVKVSKKVHEREQVGSLAVAIGLGIED
jgi:type IV pilus assembly protein PilM